MLTGEGRMDVRTFSPNLKAWDRFLVRGGTEVSSYTRPIVAVTYNTSSAESIQNLMNDWSPGVFIEVSFQVLRNAAVDYFWLSFQAARYRYFD